MAMSPTLTVEPEFKSTGTSMADDLLTIGELARRAAVPTSTVRYYERRGLLAPDAKRSGQRRYREASLRRLVFVGLMQDAGLSLDDIAGVLAADSVADWKQIGWRRLAALDEQLASLQRARAYLAGALRCRHAHPLTECPVMGTEIDRRLTTTVE
jgi:DNA-binding transcriptional MerR regulator